MRIKKKLPILGDKRTVSKFAWLPITIEHNHQRETRWLEKVTYVERYAGEYVWMQNWRKERFIDEGSSCNIV